MLDRIEQRLAHFSYGIIREDSVIEVSLPPHKIGSFLKEFKEDFGFIYLKNLGAMEDQENRFHLFYEVKNLQEKMILKVDSLIQSDQEVQSLGFLWKGALVLERKLAEHLGVRIKFEESDRVETQRYADYWGAYPGRRDFDFSSLPQKEHQLMKLPQNELPVIRDYKEERKYWKIYAPWSERLPYGFGLKLRYLDEKVVNVEVEDGFAHKGVEKLMLGKEIQGVAPFLERVNYHASLFGEILWYESIESALGLEIPQRATALRMVFLELNRISSHLAYLAGLLKRLHFDYDYRLLMDAQKKVKSLFSQMNGLRVYHSLLCLGGIRYDVPKGWKKSCHDTLNLVQDLYVHLKDKFYRERTLFSRFSKGVLTSYQAIDLCLSGPNLRASGLNYDLRKYSPTLFYQDVEFEVPLGVNGNSYDRFVIRNEEVFQSLSIISQAIDNLPIGEKTTLAKDGFEVLLMRNLSLNHEVESPTGAFGIKAEIKEGVVESFQLRSPSFSTLHALSHLSGTFEEELESEDIFNIISTLNIIDSEVDL